MQRRALHLALLLGVSTFSWGEGLLWSNVSNYPDDLMSTGDGWSATRAEDVSSFRCAADDVTFVTKVRLSTMRYFSIQVGNPDILGGDLYVYTWNGGQPGALVAALPNLAIDHSDTGWFNTVFQATVYSNTLHPNLELPPGEYFLAFRTVENRANGAKNGALTTRTAIGDATAQWNFSVDTNGNVGEPWLPMSTFNQVADQEWSFLLYGDSIYNPTSYTINLGQLNSGNVASLSDDDANALRICKFLVPNQQVAPITVELNSAALMPFVSTLSFELVSRMANAGSFSQTIELWNWNTSGWDATDKRTDALGTSYNHYEVVATGDPVRFVRQSDGALKSRYLVRQTGPSAVQIWCHDVDQAAWYVGR